MGLNIKEVTTGEWNGKRKLDVLVNGGSNVGDVKATIWEDQKDGSRFPGFDEIAVGSVIEGVLYNKPGTNFYNIYPPRPQKQGGMGGNVAKMMDKKQENIEKTLDRKEDSFKVSGTARDAVLCAIAEYEKDKTNLDTLEQLITKWRQWLWINYDKTDKDFPPF